MVEQNSFIEKAVSSFGSIVSPQTSDNRNLWMWELLALLMGFSLASVAYRRKYAGK